MDFISLSMLMALAVGSPSKAEATCCNADKAKAPAKVAKADSYVCPLTGQVLPCPNCCPANAKAGK